MEKSPQPQTPEAQLTAKVHETCRNLTSGWLLDYGYITPNQLEHVSGVTIMCGGEDEGVDLRLDIDITNTIGFVGSHGFMLKRQVGTSDKVNSLEKFTVTRQAVVEIYPKEKALNKVTAKSLSKLDRHIWEIAEKPLEVLIRLKYETNIINLSD